MRGTRGIIGMVAAAVGAVVACPLLVSAPAMTVQTVLVPQRVERAVVMTPAAVPAARVAPSELSHR